MSERVAITKELILRTAEEHEIELRPNFRWFSRGTHATCGCAAAVAAIALHPVLLRGGTLNSNDLLSALTYAELNGLSDGFEGDTPLLYQGFEGDSYRECYKIGREVREHVEERRND